MRFIELTDVDNTFSKVLINMEKIVFVRANNRKGIGHRPAGAIVYLEYNEHIRVQEEYSVILKIFENANKYGDRS